MITATPPHRKRRQGNDEPHHGRRLQASCRTGAYAGSETVITDPPAGYLKAFTLLFAQKMCQALNDMCGTQFSINKESLREGTFSTPYRMILFSGFSGAIEGNYILSLDDRIALRIIGAGDQTVSPEKALDFRKEYGALLKEALNTAVGQAIEAPVKSYGGLSYSPATAVFGEIEFPDIMCACVIIEGRAGKMLCGFSLNLADLKTPLQCCRRPVNDSKI
ncbi:MAG: hypothetical protein JXA18_04075 [Chitinispirillaceae bacterium]|nr:hypothetical protein [Chitinispirillaceae bacterium]